MSRLLRQHRCQECVRAYFYREPTAKGRSWYCRPCAKALRDRVCQEDSKSAPELPTLPHVLRLARDRMRRHRAKIKDRWQW